MAIFGFVIGFVFLLLASIYAVIIPLVLSSIGSKGKKEAYLFIIPIILCVIAWYYLLTNAPFTIAVN